MNFDIVSVQRLPTAAAKQQLRALIEAHVRETGSVHGARILGNFENEVANFWQVRQPPLFSMDAPSVHPCMLICFCRIAGSFRGDPAQVAHTDPLFCSLHPPAHSHARCPLDLVRRWCPRLRGTGLRRAQSSLSRNLLPGKDSNAAQGDV